MARKDYYHVPNAPKPNALVPAVSAIIADGEGKILLQRRRDNEFWALPGGKVELEESVAQAIIREVEEETGLRVKVIRLVGVYSDPEHIIEYSNGEIRRQFSLSLACSIESGSLLVSEESYEVKFFSVDDLKNINVHPAQLVRIKDYLANSEIAFIR